MAERAHALEERRGPARMDAAFFTPLTMLSIALFALNNLWLKHAFPGFVTGKLSDVTACFFLPQFIGVLAQHAGMRFRSSLGMGAALTALVFTGMKTSEAFSSAATALISKTGALLSIPPSRNVVDPTDLIALPFVAVALAWARHRAEQQPSC